MGARAWSVVSVLQLKFLQRRLDRQANPKADAYWFECPNHEMPKVCGLGRDGSPAVKDAKRPTPTGLTAGRQS